MRIKRSGGIDDEEEDEDEDEVEHAPDGWL